MRMLYWSIRTYWAPGTTSWSLDCFTATQQWNPPSYTTTHRYIELAAGFILAAAAGVLLMWVCVAVVYDYVSGHKERPRAFGQHPTGCLWVWHPSGHQGLQVTHGLHPSLRTYIQLIYVYLWSMNSFCAHLITPSYVSSVLHSTTGGLWPIWQICWITATSSSLTIYSKNFGGNCIWIHLCLEVIDCPSHSSTMSFFIHYIFLVCMLVSSFGSNLREFLLLEYASGLFTHHRYAYRYLSKINVFTVWNNCIPLLCKGSQD